MDSSIVRDAMAYVRKLQKDDVTGHDWYHTERVYKLASRIADGEGADRTVVQLAALLHDVDDRKLSPDTYAGHLRAVSFLTNHGCREEEVRRILSIIDQVSYKGKDSVCPDTLEGRCVQDADRLDALGAIGVARTFAYGGSHGRKIHDPDESPVLNLSEREYFARTSTSLNHFYEKLLLLADMMTTAEGKRIAKHRHAFLEGFLTEFLEEWEGTR